MLMPKRTKYRKMMKGKRRGLAHRGSTIAFGDYGLMALDNGDYGYCEVCGVEIGVRRLEARPTATLCIDCKTLDEIKERHLG